MKVATTAILLVLVLPPSAIATTWRVEKDGTGDFTVIQDALDAAASGDTVLVGPGRFEDFRIYPTNGGDRAIYAKVEVAEMTIVGAGMEETILGPEAFTWPEPDPISRGIHYIAQPSDGQLHISSLLIENTNAGIYVENAGTLAVENCRFYGGNRAVTTYSSSIIDACEFEGLREGVYSYPPADSVLVSSCTFSSCQYSADVQFAETPYGVVDGCSFFAGDLRRGGVVYDRSGGGVYHSLFERLDRSITMVNPYLPEIVENEIRSYYFCIDSTAEAFIAERNFMTSEAGPVINMAPSGLPHTFRHNHIIRGSSFAVELYNCGRDSEYHIDMSENWWGTTDTDSISAWIFDGHDDQWPPIDCFVDFEPILDQPVASEEASFGGLKALYR